MSEYLKKRNRSKNKNKKNLLSGFEVKFTKEIEKNHDVVELENDNILNQDLFKIGKFWEGKNLIEPKNTTGKLYFYEEDNSQLINNTYSNIVLSQVGDNLLIMKADSLEILNHIKQDEESIVSFVLNPMKREVICCMNNSLIRVYDLDNPQKCKKLWKINKQIGKLVKIDLTFKFLAISTSSNLLLVYDLVNFNLVNSFSGHSGFIYDIAFNPEREKYVIYSASEDGSVKIWDIVLNRMIGSLDNHSNGVRHISLTNDGKSLISITSDNTVNIWKLGNKAEDNNLINTISLNLQISSILYFTKRQSNKKHNQELSPSLLIGCENGYLCEMDLKTGSISNKKMIKYLEQPIVQIFFSSKQLKLFLLTSDQVIMHVKIDIVNDDISSSKLIKMYPAYCQEVLDVKFLPQEDNHNKLFLFSSNDNILKCCKIDGPNILTVQGIEGHSDFIMNIDVKDNFISTCSKDSTVRIWKWNLDDEKNFNYTCVALLKGHTEAVNSSCLVLKKGNMKVVTGSKDMSVKIWDFSEGVNNINYSESSCTIITQSLHSEIAHNEEVNLVKISPNEKVIASGSYDKTIKIWNQNLKQLGTIQGHKRAITDLSFSKYAKLLASSSTDKTIKIWNLNDYNCINTFEGHLSSVLKIHWIYYGTHILSGGADGLVKFWNIKNSECLNTLNAHEGKIWGLDVYSNEGTSQTENIRSFNFITGGNDSKITIWSDITKEKETEILHVEEENILKKEKLRMLNDNKEYYRALSLSLELNHKGDFMNSLRKFIDMKLREEINDTYDDQISIIINNRKYLEEVDTNFTSKINIDSYFKKYQEKLVKIINDKELRFLIKNNIDKVLEITRDNNIKSSHFLYVQIILKLILVTTKYNKFLEENSSKKFMKRRKQMNGGKNINKTSVIDYMENFSIIKSYSEKHLERINREIIKSYLIDFVLEKMKLI